MHNRTKHCETHARPNQTPQEPVNNPTKHHKNPCTTPPYTARTRARPLQTLQELVHNPTKHREKMCTTPPTSSKRAQNRQRGTKNMLTLKERVSRRRQRHQNTLNIIRQAPGACSPRRDTRNVSDIVKETHQKHAPKHQQRHLKYAQHNPRGYSGSIPNINRSMLSSERVGPQCQRLQHMPNISRNMLTSERHLKHAQHQ